MSAAPAHRRHGRASEAPLPPAAAGARGERGHDSWLGRRCPTVVLALLVVLSASSLFVVDPAPLGLLYAALLLGILVTARIGPLRLARAQIPFLLFGIGVVLVNAFTRPGVEPWPQLPVRVTAEGLVIGSALALRTLVIGAGAVAFAHVTEPRRLMVSLIRHARLSPRYAYALLAGHRMLQDLPAQWRQFTRARIMRRPEPAPLRRSRYRLTLREQASCAFALLVGAIRASERIAFALESRALTSGPRTLWRPVPVTWRDGALAVVVLGTIVAVLLGGVLCA